MGSFFLWPMIVPIIIPIIYCWKWKRENLKHLWPILLSMILIVSLYYLVIFTLEIPYIAGKFVLFVFLPLAILYWRSENRDVKKILSGLGVKRKGAEKSLTLSLFFLPVMIASWALISFLLNNSYPPSDNTYSTIMFIESFTEEFFFRGILFLYLWRITDIRIAYITSIASFVLIHPQYFWGIVMIPAIAQGIITTVIAHRSKNLAGPWVLHGATRVFSLSVLPWFL